MTDEAPEPFDAGDRSSVRKRQTEVERRRKEDEAALRTMLGTEAQRRWWWDILVDCGVYQSELLPQDAMYFRAGERNVGLRLLAAIPPDLLRLMQDEATERQK